MAGLWGNEAPCSVPEKDTGFGFLCRFPSLGNASLIRFPACILTANSEQSDIILRRNNKKGIWLNLPNPLDFLGGPSRTRTANLLIKSQLLYH